MKPLLAILLSWLLSETTVVAQKPELVIPIGHYGRINDLVESPDGQLLASASSDRTIKIWQKSTGILLKTLEAHTNGVNSIDISPDGKTLISGSADKTIRLWDISTGTLITTLGQHEGKVIYVAFSSDGNYALSLASAHFEVFSKYHNQDIRKSIHKLKGEPIKIWNISTQKEEHNLANHQTPIRILYFSPYHKEKNLKEEMMHGGVEYGKKHSIKLLVDEKTIEKNTKQGKQGNSKDILNTYKVFYQPNENKFITYNNSFRIEQWDVPGNQFSGEIDIDSLVKKTNYNEELYKKFINYKSRFFQYYSDEKNLLLVSADIALIIDKISNTTSVFEINGPDRKSYGSDTSNGTEMFTLKFSQATESFSGPITKAFISSSTHIIAGLLNGAILSYSKNGLSSQEFGGESEKNVSAVAWGNNGKSILTGHWDNRFRRFDILASTTQVLHTHLATINSITSNAVYDFASSSKPMRFGGFGEKKTLLDGIILDKTSSQSIDFEPFKNDSTPGTFHSKLSNSGKYIASFTGYPSVDGLTLFDTKKQEKIRNLNYPDSENKIKLKNGILFSQNVMMDNFSLLNFLPFSANPMQFSKDDSIVVALTNANKRIAIWDTESGHLKRDVNPNESGLRAVALSPDKNLMAYGGVNQKTTLMNLATTAVKQLSGHSNTILCLQFSPNGKYLASGSADHTIIIRESQTGKLLKTLTGHKAGVNALDFSQNGKLLLSGSDDNTTRIWNLETGLEMASLIAIDSTNWVITTPEGFFDASPAAMKKMYFVQGLETFELEQLKERYWVPGLLQELLGYRNEGLPPSPKSHHIPLPPAVRLSVKDHHFIAKISKRNGGIGKISMFINNIEINEDLRPNKNADSASQELSLKIPLKEFSHFFNSKDKNIIRVVAYEKLNEISSRGDTLWYYPAISDTKGPLTEPVIVNTKPKEDASQKQMSVYGIIIGANTLGLRYADKDALAMHRLIDESAKSFIDTTKGKVQIALFATNQSREFQPYKENIVKYLNELSNIVKPHDLFFMYYSGHGKGHIDKNNQHDFSMLLQGVNEGTRLEHDGLTSYAANLVLSSRNELTPMLNKIVASKKVFIYDACESGKAAEEATFGLTMKGHVVSKEKAFDNMYSRTGIYFLSSSAKSKMSFEHPAFEHGFLTYSLLKGVKNSEGLKYFGSEAYLDIPKWFSYALSDAPKIAASVAREQVPVFRTPGQTQGDFFIGIISDSLRNQISLSNGNKIQLAAFSFQDDKLEDIISGPINAYLREKTLSESHFWFDDKTSADAYLVKGTYSLKNGQLTVLPYLFKAGINLKPLQKIMVKATEIDKLADTLLQEIQKAINQK